ncbi:hypothetical protein NHH01_01982 [Lactococcus petauri]|nr:hypothetical protein [Lactococcus petauri]MDC7844139.1 hypothetical protein [Lactococcus petauri]
MSKGITKLKTTIILSPTPTFTKEYMPKLSIFLKKMSLLQVFLTMTKSSMTILFKTPKYDFLKSILFWLIKKSLLMPQHFVDGSVHILKKPRLIWRACTKPWVKIMSLSTRRIHLFRVRLMRIILMSFSSKKNRSPRFSASRMF